LSCNEKEAAVDVVVTPAEFIPDTWTLSDRLGRPLGKITELSQELFVIEAGPSSSPLKMTIATFPSLDSAMSAIATIMKGECQLSSGDKRQRQRQAPPT
jgi:hypothetical protein